MRASADVTIGCLVIGLLAIGVSGCSGDPGDPAAPAVEVIVNDVEPPSPEDARCRLATADAMGPDDCPAQGDGDHDGIDDGGDLCPDTTPGINVDDSGCALSSTQAEQEPG